MFPFNPSEINDRRLGPSTALQTQSQTRTDEVDEPPHEIPIFSPEKETLFKTRYEEQYNIVDDVKYNAWLKINHSEISLSTCTNSETSSDRSALKTSSASK